MSINFLQMAFFSSSPLSLWFVLCVLIGYVSGPIAYNNTSIKEFRGWFFFFFFFFFFTLVFFSLFLFFFLVYLYSLSSVLSFFWGFIHGLVYSYLICYFSQKCYSERDGLFSTYCAIYFQISTRTIIGVHICAQQRRRLEILSTFVTIVSKLSEDMCCWLRQRSPA